jgi:hypothetical protein
MAWENDKRIGALASGFCFDFFCLAALGASLYLGSFFVRSVSLFCGEHYCVVAEQRLCPDKGSSFELLTRLRFVVAASALADSDENGHRNTPE